MIINTLIQVQPKYRENLTKFLSKSVVEMPDQSHGPKVTSTKTLVETYFHKKLVKSTRLNHKKQLSNSTLKMAKF